MSSITPRRAIQRLQAERPPDEARGAMVRLDMNENTAGAPPAVARSVARAASGQALATYPEYERTRRALAGVFKVRPKELLLTNGIDDALKLICDTFVDPGDTLLIPNLTFGMYQFFHSVAGGRTRVVHLDLNLRLPVESVLAALDAPPGRKRVRWLALANPNNPTGALIRRNDLGTILRAAPETLVLIDEAYFDYSGESVLPWIRRYPNLIVSRTFSKAHGLAGLRLGALFAQRELAGWLRKAQPVFPVNSLALVAAVESVKHRDGLRRHASGVIAEREKLGRFLDALGVPHVPSAANFVFTSFGSQAPEIARRLAGEGVLVRFWSGSPHLRPYLRIGIGTAQQMRRLRRALEALRAFIEPQQPALAWRDAARHSPLARN